MLEQLRSWKQLCLYLSEEEDLDGCEIAEKARRKSQLGDRIVLCFAFLLFAKEDTDSTLKMEKYLIIKDWN
jgi:hypothetical protein